MYSRMPTISKGIQELLMAKRLRVIFEQSALYTLGYVIQKGISFLLVPIYTRALSTEDYGIIGTTGALISLLGALYPLGLDNALIRYYHEMPTEEEQRSLLGTIMLTWMIVATGATLLFLVFGQNLLQELLTPVPFRPYIELALGVSLFFNIGLIPLTLLRIKENALSYVSITLARFLLTLLLVIYFVVVARQGAEGSLKGRLLAGIVVAVPLLFWIFRQMQGYIDRRKLRLSLTFSLPLLPGALAGWTLGLSDRWLLGRFLGLDQVGIYNLAYQFGLAMNLVAASVNLAWKPFFFRKVKESNEQPYLLREVFYLYLGGLAWVALALSLLSGKVIYLMASQPFHRAEHLVPPVVWGYFFQGFYYLIFVGLLLSNRTWLITVITLAGAAVNVGLNLWFIPRIGTVAAAYATLISYFFLFLLAWVFGRQWMPIHIETRRVVILGISVLLVGGLGLWAQPAKVWLDIGVDLVCLTLFPVLLWQMGFLNQQQKNTLRHEMGKLKKRLAAQV